MSILEIIAKPPQERTLEERLILLEKENEELRNDLYLLRVSLDGSMSLCRRIEKQYTELDKVLSWVYKVINNNYTFITNH